MRERGSTYLKDSKILGVKCWYKMDLNRSNRRTIHCQTERCELVHVTVQRPDRLNSSTQTIDSGPSKAKVGPVNVDYHRLYRFLHRSVPLIEAEIRDSCQFDQLSASWLNYWNGSSGVGIHCEKRLTSKILDDLSSDIKSTPAASSQVISGTTWNAPQTTLAVSYKVKHHPDWCTHKTFLILWNVFIRRSESITKPLYCCEIDNCVTCLTAHPTRGSIYAIGCYNGSIAIADTRLLETGSDLVSDLPISHGSPSRGDLHQDSIGGLYWLPLKNDEFHLISFSNEGSIIRWKLNEKTKSLEPLDLYNIILTDLPKSMGLKLDSQVNCFKCVPILSFTWEPEDDSGFIVGCEAGALFRCSLHGRPRPETIDDAVRPSDWLPVKNPIVTTYVPHRAGVTNLSFSPNLRNIFTSSGKDNELRVWQVFQSKPLFVIHCDVNIISSVWLYSRPLIITVEEDGFICLYSISSRSRPKLTHRFSLEERKTARTLWTNHAGRDDQIAISDEDNTTHLYSVQPTEENVLQSSD